ncbi:SDR family NAD(P)-dependent oxidoreductase [Bacillus sp. FJAT-42315]|uniref:SDR family NAD(P)-dependent oxidoreductase n=1 Tax=Bacillus sp. FJAT-42315 TaxID=2014077 RepID=UPI000C246D5A|nr:SDR family NAD(P)-dependent oxidoreductase [Bacillus sp. FJAT-42315]
MKKTLVVGATGGMGYAIVKELSRRGIETIAFARTKPKLDQLFGALPNVQIIAGDVFHLEDLKKAANGVDIIYHAINIPYELWEEKLVMLNKNIIEAAKANHCKLAVVDNIYAYGRNPGHKITEMTPKHPHTKKGKIRLQLEELYAHSGVPTVQAHFPDFYGPNATSTVMHTTLQNIIKGKKAMYVGDIRKQREFIYTPDGAKALIELSTLDHAYHKHWNIPGTGTLSGQQLKQILEQITDRPHAFSQVNKGMIRFLSLFSRNMREVVEMMYLYEDPVILSGETYEKEIGPLPQTPYEEGLAETIQFMMKES